MAFLTILYDGGCPLCLREVRFLEQRDRRRHPLEPRLAFVDIDAAGYDPQAHAGIGYREAMGRIHAIAADGEVLRDVAVFRRAYALIGLGWLYAPTTWPLLATLVNLLYSLWAGSRLRLTGRPNLDQLCAVGGRCVSASGLGAHTRIGSGSPASVSDQRPHAASPLVAAGEKPLAHAPSQALLSPDRGPIGSHPQP